MSESTLVDIGAPPLAPGQFYRIRNAGFFGMLEIELRERRKRFGSRLLGDAIVLPAEFDNGVEAVVFGCHKAVENAERRAHRGRTTGEALRLAGDHD